MARGNDERHNPARRIRRPIISMGKSDTPNFGTAIGKGLALGLTGARSASQQAEYDEDPSTYLVQKIADSLDATPGIKRIE